MRGGFTASNGRQPSFTLAFDNLFRNSVLNVPFELDHIFICASCGGTEASRLVAFGLAEGTSNTHPGQGTACRRFFFANCYIELLWVSNTAEARSDATRETHLGERWENRSRGCPFGFGFRPRIPHDGVVPFSSWEYRPSYLPASWSIHMATNGAVLSEPMLFYLSFAQRPDAYPAGRQQPLRQPAGLREVTRVTLTSPQRDGLSPAMAAVIGSGLVQLRAGCEYLVELGFDGESGHQQADFRPLLPLAFRW
jgi:hypothetical protein